MINCPSPVRRISCHGCCLRYFELALTRSGYELVTNPIPFDAVALGSDEVPAETTTSSLVTCENDAGNNEDECPDSRLEQSGSMQMKVRSEGLNTVFVRKKHNFLRKVVRVARKEIGHNRKARESLWSWRYAKRVFVGFMQPRLVPVMARPVNG